LGSDVLKYRPDWRVIDNPFANKSFAEGDPIVLLPAIKPDVALIHAPMADRAGNVWIGRQRELATMAHASGRTIVTVEKIYDGDLLADPVLAAGVLPGFYVERIAVAEKGCWPLGLPDRYAADLGHLAEYARMAATAEGFKRYLDEHV
jgi:glutaconate CoA-transferase subunit A